MLTKQENGLKDLTKTPSPIADTQLDFAWIRAGLYLMKG